MGYNGGNPKKQYLCEWCGMPFWANLRHGKLPKYCSFTCFGNDKAIVNEYVDLGDGTTQLLISGRRIGRFEVLISSIDVQRARELEWKVREAEPKEGHRMYNVIYSERTRIKHSLLLAKHILGVAGADVSKEVFYKNGNRLDNRRENIVLDERKHIRNNTKKPQRNNSTGVRNVYYEASSGLYRVMVQSRGVRYTSRHTYLKDAEAAAIEFRRNHQEGSVEYIQSKETK